MNDARPVPGGTRSVLAMHRRHVVMLHAIAFVIGFSLVFIAAGASASAIGSSFAEYRSVFARICGVVVVILGLNMLGVFRMTALSMDRRPRISRGRIGYAASLLTGFAFAAGWTPCVGPILAGVLALAGNAQSINTGTALLAVYSMGLAVPFLLMAFTLQRALPLLVRVRGALPSIELASGIVVTAIGVVLVVADFGRATAWLYAHFPSLAEIDLDTGSGGVVTFGTAFLAGLASFVSPCVLPLMPAYLSMLTGQSVEELAASGASQ